MSERNCKKHDMPIVPMPLCEACEGERERALVEACEAALKGYQNILDSDLMPHKGYDADTKMLINTLSAVLAKARGE